MFYPINRLRPERPKPPPEEVSLFGNLKSYRADMRNPVREIPTLPFLYCDGMSTALLFN